MANRASSKIITVFSAVWQSEHYSTLTTLGMHAPFSWYDESKQTGNPLIKTLIYIASGGQKLYTAALSANQYVNFHVNKGKGTNQGIGEGGD